MHELVGERLGADDDLPCADYALLVPLKRSRVYGAVRKRVADLSPADAWRQEGFHFFVFDLHPVPADGTPAEGPVAVFAMHSEATEPVSAVVVTPSAESGAAEIANLLQPESTYTAPLPQQTANPLGGDPRPAPRPSAATGLGSTPAERVS